MATTKRSRRKISFSGVEVHICVLCQNSHSHMSTPSAWKNEQARKLVLSLQVSLESLVCRPCRDDITRMLSNSHYIPRWKKRIDENTKQDEKASCCVLECNNSHFASITSGTAHQISSAFDILGVKCSINPIPVPTPMCKSHYHTVYDTLHSRQTPSSLPSSLPLLPSLHLFNLSCRRARSYWRGRILRRHAHRRQPPRSHLPPPLPRSKGLLPWLRLLRR